MKSQFIEYPASAPAGESESGASSGRDGGMLGQARESVTQAAREGASKLKATASDTATRAKDEVARVATEKKDEAAERVGGYSSVLHQSASTLEEKDPNIAWFTHRVADRLQGVADYVRERNWGDIRSDTEDLARRHPAAFFGGMLVAGLVLGNVLKASRTAAAADQGPSSDEPRDVAGSDDFEDGSLAEPRYANLREET